MMGWVRPLILEFHAHESLAPPFLFRQPGGARTGSEKASRGNAEHLIGAGGERSCLDPLVLREQGRPDAEHRPSGTDGDTICESLRGFSVVEAGARLPAHGSNGGAVAGR